MTILNGRVCAQLCHFRAGGKGGRSGVKVLTPGPFGRVRRSVFCHHGSAALLDRRPGAAVAGRAGGCEQVSGPHRGAHHVRTGLRVSEVLELEWRDLDYLGEPATLIVRRSKTRRARTVRMHGELVQLFTNWPANRAPRDKVVDISMRTVLRHIGDAVVASGLEQESPGTGKRLSRVNHICRLASISFAGSPPRPGSVAGLHRSGSWGRQTPG